MTATALDVRDVDVSYGAVHAVRQVSFTAVPGELIALVGPNGAGKSSLMRAILGLVPYRGHVALHGRWCEHRAHRVRAAFVPQRIDADLSFPITVGQVVASGRRPFRRPGRRASTQDRVAIGSALERVGLSTLASRPIGELSGGQAQRAFVARALAQEADVLLLDEPLANVDAAATHSLLELFSSLARDGACLVIATHDLALVARRFERCLAINERLTGDGAPSSVLAGEGLRALFGLDPLDGEMGTVP